MAHPTRRCSHCQADLSNLVEGISFCPNCGRPVGDSLAESPGAAPVPDTPKASPPTFASPPPPPPPASPVLRQVCTSCGNIIECAPETTLCPICRKPLTAAAVSKLLLPRGVGILVGETTKILLLSLATGLTVTLLAYLLLWQLVPPKAWLRSVLFPEGAGQIIPWATLLLLFWGGIWLALRAYFLKQEKQAVMEALVQNLGERLTRDEAAIVLSELQSLPEEKLGIFWRRVRVALAEWQRSRSLEQVRAALTDQAYLDADSLESSLNLIRVLIWAAPILGFIGTVLGISFAIGDFSTFLGGQAGAGNLQMSQIQAGLVGVTSGLALAFNTTLVGLFVALLLMIPTSYVQKTEEEFLSYVYETVANQVLAPLTSALPALPPTSRITEWQSAWGDQQLRREDLEQFGEKLSAAIKELAGKITPLTGTFDLRFIPRAGSPE